jgi:hypothetical protein
MLTTQYNSVWAVIPSGVEGNVIPSGVEGNVIPSGVEGNVIPSGVEGNVIPRHWQAEPSRSLNY